MNQHISVQDARGRGFTLVELIVVIAIVSLLIALLLPALSGARNTARDVMCSSNIRSQMIYYQLYVDDYKDWLRFYAYKTTGTERLWYGGILGFNVGTTNTGNASRLKMFICSRENDGFGAYNAGLFSYTHYGLNLRVAGGIVPDPSLSEPGPADPPRKASEIKKPSVAMIISDNNRKDSGQGNTHERIAFRHSQYTGISISGNTKSYEGDGSFYVGFFDGHVDARKRSFFLNSSGAMSNSAFYSGI